MSRKVLGLASFIVGIAVAGCGGGGGQQTYPDAMIDFDAQPETTPPKVDAMPETMPAPMAAPTSKRLVEGGAMLIGSGPESCTNQEPAPGDRWCAFTQPGTALGFNELWVINVTKAAAAATTPGAASVKCNTTDLNCLRLSTALYEDFDLGFRLHGFDGDTLIYYDEPTQSPDGFVGTIKAWRPGWTAGRKLTDETGVVCAGHKTSAAVLCFNNVFTDAAVTVRTADLHAGLLTEQGGGLLPKVDTILIAAKNDVDGVRKWRADLSPDGKRVAWSSRADAAGVEILKVQTIGDDASRKTVAEDVSEWTITADGAKWLWLRKFNYDQTGAPAGTLESAPFPDGTGATMLATAVGEYSDAGSKSVIFRSKMKADVGDLFVIPDREAPAGVAMLDQGVLFVFDQSKDGTKAVYTKNAESISAGLSSAPIFDLYVAANDGKRPCTLAATPIAFLPPDFLGSDYSAWGRLNTVTGEVEGMYTSLATCVTKKFAAEIFSWVPINDEGYVFLDELALDPSVNEATLRYALIKDGMLPAAGTKIQTRSQFVYAPLLPTLSAVVYNVRSGNKDTDGLYINASLPFKTTPVVPPPDGGTPDVPANTDAGTPGTDAPVEAAADAGGGTDAAVADADPDAGG